MSIDVGQLIDYVIKPSLKQVNLYSLAAEQIVLGTSAQETELISFVHQKGGGPALGGWQCEPATHSSMWNDFLFFKPELSRLILSSCGFSKVPPVDELITNLKYAAIMCRVRYLWVKEALPEFGDIEGQGAYWGKYYNGNPVNGKAENYVRAYKKFIGDYYK